MKQLIFVIVLLLGSMVKPAQAQQQKGSLSGRAIDAKTKAPLEYVSFAVKNAHDSTVVAMGATGQNGNFAARNLKEGQYKFYLAIIGYKPLLKLFEITSEKSQIAFGDMALEEEAITLNSIMIKGDLLPMIIKKDTIEFNADAFKTQADASLEDALRGMPGMEVDPDGNISFNGKKIDKVLVDGRDFFGNDPKVATRNLPKEIIDKIQVIEKKTDDALFKGIDDGKRENVLNVTTKADKKKGYFGNIAGGIGNSGLYDASLNINRFNNKRQLSLIGMANNINKTSFSFNDLSDFLGGDIFGLGGITSISISAGGGMSFNMGDGDFGASGGGINDNKGLGLNYNDEWGKRPKYPNKISLNYMVNHNSGLQQSLSSRLNLLGGDSFFNDKSSDAHNASTRHRLTARIDIPIDSANKLQISPNFGFSSSDNRNSSDYSSYTQNGLQPINKGASLSTGDNTAPAFGGKLLFNHRFKKAGRTISFNANGNYSHSALDGMNFSDVTIYDSGTPTSNILNQLIDQTGQVNGYGMGADYSEPLNKKLTLGLNYDYSRRSDLVDRVVYDYDAGVSRYSLINNELSRNLRNFNDNNTMGLRLTYVSGAKYNISLNSRQKLVGLSGRNLMNGMAVSNQYFVFEPSLNMSYKIGPTSNLNLSFYRFTGVPSVSQLQPLTDNSNPLQITTGNPNLRPSADNSLNFSYNRFNPASGSSFNFSLFAGSSENRITNNSTLDPKTGIQTTFYDNISGAYNFGFRVGGGLKWGNLSVNPSVGVNGGHNRSFLNSRIVSSQNTSLNANAMINYTVGSNLQFYNRVGLTKRQVSYGYNNLPDQNFTTVSNNLNLNVTLPYEFRFTLSSNLIYNANVGIGNNNSSIHMANVSIEKLFLEKQLSFKASVSDVFNNSRNTGRYATDTYIMETVNLGMRRYFLFSVSYRLRKFGETANAAPRMIMGAPMVF